jgi:hypothetical protein
VHFRTEIDKGNQALAEGLELVEGRLDYGLTGVRSGSYLLNRVLGRLVLTHSTLLISRNIPYIPRGIYLAL